MEKVIKSTNSQPWIYSARADGMFILAPAFLATLVVILFPHAFGEGNEVSPWAWLLLIVGIDVAHVYSTLFRTYFDSEEFRKYRKPLLLIPLIGLAGGLALYAAGSGIFWTCLAYLAVYHFVRQQYGFFRIYARKEVPLFPFERPLDSATIYASTIYPLIYWHCHLPRNFYWFMPGDFIPIPWEGVSQIAGWVYLVLLLAYVLKEGERVRRTSTFNWPKNLILLGTALSWYVGIVLYNGDLAFTATNVVAHGIPYMALIWMYGRKKAGKSGKPQPFFRLEMIPMFVGVLLLFAFLEEGLWDALVWRDHPEWFRRFLFLPQIEKENLLIWVVPLLAIPQVTHYLIDGFIWRVRGKDNDLRNKVLEK